MKRLSLSRAHAVVLGVGLLACGVALGSVAASLRSAQPPASPTPVMSTPAPNTTAALPEADVPGADIARLPRYPGAVRSAHDVVLDAVFRLTANEYLVDAAIDDVRAFYQGVIVEHGWERADIGFNHGEWSYVLVDGSAEALIEIEELGGVVEIDLQLSESAAPATPRPVEPVPTPTPATPPPPPPGDDDDGDDDDGGDDDDDSDDGGESDDG